MAKILIVEDEDPIAASVADCLSSERHTTERAPDGRTALELLGIFEYDLILMDWNMPNLSGIEVCRSFRSSGGQTPIIMVTGNNKIKDIVTGLDSGADDYITKPFEPVDLLGRVRAILRRYVAQATDTVSRGALRLDPNSMQAFLSEVPLKLRPREFSLLQFFLQHSGQHFSARDLINRVWAQDGQPSMEAVRQSVKRLRDAMETVAPSPCIRFDKSLGYVLAFD